MTHQAASPFWLIPSMNFIPCTTSLRRESPLTFQTASLKYCFNLSRCKFLYCYSLFYNSQRDNSIFGDFPDDPFNFPIKPIRSSHRQRFESLFSFPATVKPGKIGRNPNRFWLTVHPDNNQKYQED